jgi:tryptophan 2,3-dioxygenase
MQFREIEFMSGLKDERLMKFFETDDFAFTRLKNRFETGTLHDAYFEFLSRRGFSIETYENRVLSVVDIIKDIERYPEEFELQEILIQHDELTSHWRFHHIKMVERTVGLKQGTGGSEGVGYLQTTLTKRFYPEFWEARTRLEIE